MLQCPTSLYKPLYAFYLSYSKKSTQALRIGHLLINATTPYQLIVPAFFYNPPFIEN
jgi:hypothetical protein